MCHLTLETIMLNLTLWKIENLVVIHNNSSCNKLITLVSDSINVKMIVVNVKYFKIYTCWDTCKVGI